jgi:hypothetical protein
MNDWPAVLTGRHNPAGTLPFALGFGLSYPESRTGAGQQAP